MHGWQAEAAARGGGSWGWGAEPRALGETGKSSLEDNLRLKDRRDTWISTGWGQVVSRTGGSLEMPTEVGS